MGTFIQDGAAVLPPVKTNATTPTGASTEWAAEDANQERTALLDLRTEAIQEKAERERVDALIIASGAEPANVGIAPVITSAEGSVTARMVKDHLGATLNLKDADCKCDGVTNDYGALVTLLATLGNKTATVIVSGNCYVESDITFPATIEIRFENGGVFSGPGVVKYVEQFSPARTKVVTAQGGGRIAFVFDDGYASNYHYALPIFQKYGMAATIAVETEKIGQDYNDNPAYPEVTAEQMRRLVRAGWEISNHPSLYLTKTEQEMVDDARVENERIVKYLTGEFVEPNAQPGTLLYPEFSDYQVRTAVYRGGARNETSDKAYRYLYRHVRSINGTEVDRGNHLNGFHETAERTTQCSALGADITSSSLNQILGWVESVAQTRSEAILYAHDTPLVVPPVPAAPYILASDLEIVLRRCHELGVAVVPLCDLYVGNAVRDSRFDDASGYFQARAGDTAAFDTGDTLLGSPRSVKLTSVAAVSNENTNYTTVAFVCEAFCRYRIRVRYKIDVALDIGGAGNWNHGLHVGLETGEGNTMGTSVMGHINFFVAGNEADPASSAKRCPYDATAGWAEYDIELMTGNGPYAQIKFSLYNCIGTVRIGNIIAEKLQGTIDIPYIGTSTFNTSAGRLIYLPNVGGSAARICQWDVKVIAPLLTFNTTINYAYRDPSQVAAPGVGTTCFVLSPATGAFAGHAGALATYNGAAWVFSNLNVGEVYKVSNFNGSANVYFRLLANFGGNEPLAIQTSYSPYFDDPGFWNPSDSKVYNTSGLRSDSFTWVARLIPDGTS